MEWKVVMPFYEKWTESEEYKIESAVDNHLYDEYTAEICEVIGKKAFHDISDSVVNLSCEAESIGFAAGFRHGILFMAGVLKGGVA